MRPSKDEIWEWALMISKKYGVPPMRPIGMLDMYSFDDYAKGMNRVEEAIKKENEHERAEIKRQKGNC